MTALREAARMALDALEKIYDATPIDQTRYDLCKALREALAAPMPEPVAWTWDTDGTGGEMKGHYEAHFQFNKPHPDKRILNLTPLYAAPPAAPMPEPVAWGMFRADGLILDVITPEEHESHAGEYTVPLYAAPPAAPADSQPRATKPVVSQKAANLTNNADMVMVPREPTPEMIEASFRVSATMWHEGEDDRRKEAYRAMLMAAPKLPGVSQGWKIVPLEPTLEMGASGDAVWVDCARVRDCIGTTAVYRAMIAAAPAPVVPAECCRNELLTALHSLASNYENALGMFGQDGEGRRKAEGDLAHAMKVAAKHNRNGPGCAAPVVREPLPKPRTAGCLLCGHCAATGERVAKPAARDPIIDKMDAVASKYAHKLALDLECVLSDYHGKWWDTAINTLGEYREAMNAIHERESPTHMGEPVLPRKNCDRPDCPAGGYGPCAPCEREHSGG